MNVNHEESHHIYETTIEVEGIEREIVVFHVTDSHLVEVAAEDMKEIMYDQTAPLSAEQYKQKITITPAALNHFRRALKRAKQRQADMLALTGDIMTIPSSVNLEIVKQELAELNLPYLYTLGNHDWQYFTLEDWNDQIRAQRYPKFYPFTNGNPAYQMTELGGVQLIAIDNSNYQVDEEQYLFVRDKLATGKPSLLFMHIPLYLPTLTPDVVSRWDAPIMMNAEGWSPQRQTDWKVRAADASTRKLYQLLTEGEADNLLGIFCGHVHFAHQDEFRKGRYQYVTHPGYDSGFRVITLKPLQGQGR